MIVKICGITTPDDAVDAVRAGADWLGLNFWPRSKRAVGLDVAAEIAAAARAEAGARGVELALVGVFVNQTDDFIHAARARATLDFVQLHGDETPARCAELRRALWPRAPLDADSAGQEPERAADRDAVPSAGLVRAVALRDPGDIDAARAHRADVLLIDTPSADYGGSGRVGDWAIAAAVRAAGCPVLLAGGLTPDNVAQAIARVGPFGVDVASGVEGAPGSKDAARMRAFVAAARSAQRSG
ncbi:MAG: phosphoribosylanthranilate isomerase [Haliangiales bacterium]